MIRKLMKEEYKNAINLSYQVCIECGINDFTEEGIETFKSFVYDTSLMNTLDIYGAFDNHLLIGIIGVHRERQHISLFFVLPHYHRQGIGKSLFDYMMSNCNFTYGKFYQFNLSSCIRQQNSLTAQFVSFSLSNLANIFYPPPIFTIINLCLL